MARFDATDADYRYSKHHQYCDLTDDLHWVEDVPGDKEEAGNLCLSVYALATAFILVFRCHSRIKSLQSNDLLDQGSIRSSPRFGLFWHFDNGAASNIYDVLTEHGGLLHVLPLTVHLDYI